MKIPHWFTYKFLKYYFYSAERIAQESRRIYLDKYYSGGNSVHHYSKEEQIIIFMVDGRHPHGGLADRLKGLVATYTWAKERGYSFKINWTSPFFLGTFFDTNLKNCYINPDEISYTKDESLPICIFDYDMPDQRKIFTRLMDKHVDTRHKQFHVYSNIKGYENCFSNSLHELFSLTPKLSDELNKYLLILGNDYITCSFRFLNLLGDFNDPGATGTLSEGDRNKLIDLCINQLNILNSNLNHRYKILVASDSTTFIKHALHELDFIYSVQGEIIHMDEKDDTPSDYKHIRTFIDFLLIAKAKRSYLFHTDSMYMSNFPRYASLLGNHEYKVIEF